MRSLISQLKIPGQPSRLTRMMVVGCEGNILADWTWTLGHGASAGWRGPALERSFTWTGGASLPAIIPKLPTNTHPKPTQIFTNTPSAATAGPSTLGS